MDGTYSNSQKYFGNNSTSPKTFWDRFQLPKKLCGTTSTFDLHKWDLFHSSFSFWDLVYCPHYPIQPHIGLEIEINNKASSFIRIQPITDDTVQHLKQCNVLRKDCWWQKWSAHMQNSFSVDIQRMLSIKVNYNGIYQTDHRNPRRSRKWRQHHIWNHGHKYNVTVMLPSF